MPYIEFGCRPTIIGSMPQTDPVEACNLIVRFLKDIPAWPQLPERSFLENMYVQYSEGFPGVVVEGNHIHIDTSQDYTLQLENLYKAYLENKVDVFPISKEYAAGLHVFVSTSSLSPMAVKGHVTGPISWGLTVTDQNRRSILYDETLADAVAKMLRLKAAWQETKLKEISNNTIIFVDEPYMSSFGSAYISISREQAISFINEVFGGISGLKGIHCCGNTDWTVLLDTGLDILNFDAYNYAVSLSLYPDEVKKFLDRSGTIAWGIIPNQPDEIIKESVASLKDRLEEAMAPFTRHGVRFRQMVAQSILTPSCTLVPLKTNEACARALELLTELSSTMRRRYL